MGVAVCSLINKLLKSSNDVARLVRLGLYCVLECNVNSAMCMACDVADCVHIDVGLGFRVYYYTEAAGGRRGPREASMSVTDSARRGRHCYRHVPTTPAPPERPLQL